jgi:hypothetical protein
LASAGVEVEVAVVLLFVLLWSIEVEEELDDGLVELLTWAVP